MKPSLVIIMVMLFGCGTTLFGLGLSAGAMIDFAPVNEHLGYTFAGASAYNNINIPELRVGAYLDAQYAQLSVAFAATATGTEKVESGGSTTTSDFNYNFSYVSTELLGKYPFKLGSVNLFPLLGAEYDFNLTYVDTNGNDLRAAATDQQRKDLNQLWLKVGAGADFNITRHFYLRPEVLFGYKIPSQTDKDAVDSLKAGGATDVSFAWTRWDFSVMAGYSF